jgi:hypothetical protein
MFSNSVTVRGADGQHLGSYIQVGADRFEWAGADGAGGTAGDAAGAVAALVRHARDRQADHSTHDVTVTGWASGAVTVICRTCQPHVELLHAPCGSTFGEIAAAVRQAPASDPVAYLVAERRDGQWLLGEDYATPRDTLAEARELAARTPEGYEVGVLAVVEIDPNPERAARPGTTPTLEDR